MTAPANNIIDEKDALRVVAQMTIGEIVRGIAALSKSAPVAESPASDGTREWPRVFKDEDGEVYVCREWDGTDFYQPNGSFGGVSGCSPRECLNYRTMTELTGPAKLAKLKELGCDERGVYVGKGETREWPKLVGCKNGETYAVVWVYRSERDGEFWNSNSFIAADGTMFSRLADPENTVLDTPEARAFIAKRYDEQGNLRAEYRKGETGKVRVFANSHFPGQFWVMRGEHAGQYLMADGTVEEPRMSLTALGMQPHAREIPPAEVPQWLSDHGYAIDGTRRPETPATPIDPDAGRKYGEAVQDLVRFAQDTHVACMKWGKFESGSIEETNLVSEILTAAHTASLAANRVKRLDAAQGGVR